MKIAIFTDSFFPGIGGTEKAVLGLAQELSKNNEVVVACPKMSQFDDSIFPFKVIRCNSVKLPGENYLSLPSLSKNLFNEIAEFSPDIIHCQSIYGFADAGIKFAKKLDIPVIMTLHTKFKQALKDVIKFNTVVNVFKKSWGNKLNECDKVCAVSADMNEEIKDYGYNGDFSVIKNGMMFNKIKNHEENKILAQQTFNLTNSDNVLLFVGRIVKIKNLDCILKSLSFLKNKDVNYKMLIVGDGPDLNYYKKMANDLNLNDNVLFTGKISDTKLLSSIYSASDLFLFPSIFDNDPLTIVEAAVHRTPSIVFKNTGSSDRIKNNLSGFIVERDEYCFASKVLELLNEKEKIIDAGLNAETLIPTTWKETADIYIDIYKNLIDDKIKNFEK